MAKFALVPAWVFDRLSRLPLENLHFYIWLNLFVAGEGDQGYKRIGEIAQALDISERTAKRRVQALRDAGVVEVRRFKRKDGLLGQNVYYLPRDEPGYIPPPPPDGEYMPEPLEKFDTRPKRYRQPRAERGATQGGPTLRGGAERGATQGGPSGGATQGGPSINPETHSTQTAEPLRGSPAAPAAPAEQPPLIPDEIIEGELVANRPLPTPAGASLLPVPGAPNAGVITREWVDYCAERGVKLANETIKRYARAVKTAADEGFTERVIRGALGLMARDRVISRPALFATYLTRVQTGPELPPERLSRAQADRLRQTGDTPEDTAAQVAAFLAIPDPRRAPAS